MASSPEQHCVSMLCAAQLSGRPAASASMRAGLPPAPSALPSTTASTAVAGRPLCASSDRSKGVASSCSCNWLSAPPTGVTGLRVQAMMGVWRCMGVRWFSALEGLELKQEWGAVA